MLPGVSWSSPETPVWYSLRLKESLGFRDDEFPNVLQSWLVRLHPDDRDRILRAVADHVERRVPYDVEYRLREVGRISLVQCGGWAFGMRPAK